MPLVGVKFCGGCNPKHERGKALDAVRERIGGHVRFAYAEEGRRYDLLLYIAGCVNRCTALGAYSAEKGIVSLWEESQTASVCAQIEDILRWR
jgi:hypothetical protein